eukprot:CAMPEP_0174363358 /NCGR_PEP_ID=MMETSP0811_2-20130205/68527_1 /TAXON_ID=73025 ORGANISM="Eutreptiella gymnastica-like, Strain CCMP1594" /NCGR_SAMPLE_ID=MMETSP0811_2 /ASSEMBLY_ACC=CAM_ASM_000667 /LENGTH=58 /DNA_ID=CAMNT_0015501979 /DNA_START=566 /DNA_END=742 /DNA_ORIENTATION=+
MAYSEHGAAQEEKIAWDWKHWPRRAPGSTGTLGAPYARVEASWGDGMSPPTANRLQFK